MKSSSACVSLAPQQACHLLSDRALASTCSFFYVSFACDQAELSEEFVYTPAWEYLLNNLCSDKQVNYLPIVEWDGLNVHY